MRKHRRGVHAVERRRACAQVEVIGIRAGIERVAAPDGAADVDETMGFGDAGRRTEEQRVRDGEDRRVRADADGERHRGCEREERIAPEEAQGVPDVLRNAAEHILLKRFNPRLG